jgi:hypothetical protein
MYGRKSERKFERKGDLIFGDNNKRRKIDLDVGKEEEPY